MPPILGEVNMSMGVPLKIVPLHIHIFPRQENNIHSNIRSTNVMPIYTYIYYLVISDPFVS